MAKTFHLNPERVAYVEANGWRAYYERDWLKVLRLLVMLCQEQFHIPFPMSLLAAYYKMRKQDIPLLSALQATFCGHPVLPSL